MKRASPILAGLWLLASVMPAFAAPPSRDPAPLPDLIEDTSCGYLVNVTFPVNSEFAVSFFNASGDLTRLIIAGHLVVRFTNPATGVSVTANISGPSVIDFVRGTNKVLGPTGGPITGLSGLSLFSGQVDSNTGARHGHFVLDVCAALAA
jgi:hypothetical protein